MTLPCLRIGFSVLTAVLALAPAALVACSSDESSPTSGGDAAVAESGTGSDTSAPVDGGGGTDTSAPVDSGLCPTVVNGAGVVGETAAAGARPAAAGGAIADGTYYMTKHEVYAPGTPDANSRKRTWSFTGNTFRVHNNDTGAAELQISGTFTTSGTTLTLVGNCPTNMSGSIQYTATATTFTEHASSGEDLFIFTKQ